MIAAKRTQKVACRARQAVEARHWWASKLLKSLHRKSFRASSPSARCCGGTAALVGRDGFIDRLCWPRFDSGACFAALLGRPEHGRWLIAPRDSGARVRRRYLDGSLILVTTFETADGAVELIDFLPPRDDGADLVRLIRGVRGHVELRTEFILRFDYGFSVPWIEHLEDAGLRAVAGQVESFERPTPPVPA